MYSVTRFNISHDVYNIDSTELALMENEILQTKT